MHAKVFKILLLQVHLNYKNTSFNLWISYHFIIGKGTRKKYFQRFLMEEQHTSNHFQCAMSRHLKIILIKLFHVTGQCQWRNVSGTIQYYFISLESSVSILICFRYLFISISVWRKLVSISLENLICASYFKNCLREVCCKKWPLR